jgi:hypothetical protein
MEEIKAHVEKRIADLEKLQAQYEKETGDPAKAEGAKHEIYAIKTTLMYLEDIVKRIPD